MKTLIIITFTLILTCAAFAQPVAVSEKDAKKLAKEQKKAEEKALKAEIQKRTVDFLQLTKFPGTYTGRPLRIERAAITDIQARTEGGVTYYLMALEKDTESTVTYPLPDQITFIIEEGMAKGLVAHIDQMRKGGVWPRDFNPVSDVYFELSQKDLNDRRYYIAKVSCVGVYGFLSKITRYGSCSIDFARPNFQKTNEH